MALAMQPTTDAAIEHVVLLDERGRPRGITDKATVHTTETPLHLAFSCYVVDEHDRVLLTRRAATKRTWPGTWTNACCGHPQLGERIEDAVRRRLQEELGLAAGRIAVALPDFAYRAVMDDGTVEHELCPVLVAEVTGRLDADPAEVDGHEWVAWSELVARAEAEPWSLSPWSVQQIARLAVGGPSPAAFLAGPGTGLDVVGLDPVRLDVGERWSTGDDLAGGATEGPDASGALLPVLRPVERQLRRVVAERRAELLEIDPSLEGLASAIEDLVAAGGKRLRPAFVLWGHLAADGEHQELAIAAGAAVELLHTFALLHDDVMDRSATRRGMPAAHVGLAWSEAKDPAWFGTCAAILAGDLAQRWADDLFDELPIPLDVADRARRRYALLQREVIAGQFLDLRLAETADPGDEDAVKVALLKTARYSVTRPLQLGAALAGGRDARDQDALDERLAAYGDAVGLVFQLRDDVLGLYGDPSTTGKSRIDDLREGKQTLLVLRAMALADPEDREALRRCLGDPDLTEGDAARCRAIVARSGALASVEARIAAEHRKAVAALEGFPARSRAALTTLADLAAFRSR